MHVVDLYNGIFRVLANDNELLSLLGIGATSSRLTRALRIQKRSRPQELVKNLPMITFYTPGGAREFRNRSVFNHSFVFDVYTADDVDLAQRIAKRVVDLFDGNINPFVGVENFEAEAVDGFESLAGAPNVYCFTVHVNFSVTVGC